MRRHRKLVDGAWYHVTARANHQEFYFDNPSIRDLFLSYVAKAKKRLRFKVANFCVMGNHIHLLIQPGPGENLSEIMRSILGYFARAFNTRYGTSGHFWEKRFYSRVVQSLRQFLGAFSYIDTNPIKARLAANVFAWRHGGAWHALAGIWIVLDRPPPWLSFLMALRRLPTALTEESRNPEIST